MNKLVILIGIIFVGIPLFIFIPTSLAYGVESARKAVKGYFEGLFLW